MNQILIGGIAIAYIGEGEGPPAGLAHCSSGSHCMWRGLLPPLSLGAQRSTIVTTCRLEQINATAVSHEPLRRAGGLPALPYDLPYRLLALAMRTH